MHSIENNRCECWKCRQITTQCNYLTNICAKLQEGLWKSTKWQLYWICGKLAFHLKIRLLQYLLFAPTKKVDEHSFSVKVDVIALSKGWYLCLKALRVLFPTIKLLLSSLFFTLTLKYSLPLTLINFSPANTIYYHRGALRDSISD